MRALLAALGLGFLGAAVTGGATGAAAPLAAGLAAGIAGNLATDLFKHLDRGVCERFLDGWRGIDENHHIVASLRLAQINALRALVSDFEDTLGQHDNRGTDAPGLRFVARSKEFLSAETTVAMNRQFAATDTDSDLRRKLISLLPETFDDALADRRSPIESTPPNQSSNPARSVTETAVLEELQAHCAGPDGKLPPEFEMLFSGQDGKSGWFDLFVRDAAEKLAQPGSEFATIWNAEQVALIKAYVEATRVETSATARNIAALREQFDCGLITLSSVRSRLEDIHQEIEQIGRQLNKQSSEAANPAPSYSPFAAIAASPLYEDCRTLILYMYINDAEACTYSNAYEYECLRVGHFGQYFGFEYTPYAIGITRDEDSPKRNRPHYRAERLKWLAVATILVKAGILIEELRGDRIKTKYFRLSDEGRIIAAEAISWLQRHDPAKVPMKNFSA